MDQNMSFRNMLCNDYQDSFSFLEDKTQLEQNSYADTYCTSGNVGLKPLTPLMTPMSNSILIEEAIPFTAWILLGVTAVQTPEISSVLTAILEDVQAQFPEDACPAKKAKSSSELVSNDENTVNKLPHGLSYFDSHMKLFQVPFLESNWDASIDALLCGDAN